MATRKKDAATPAPTGDAEAKRLQRRNAAAAKLTEAEGELANAQQALAHAQESMFSQGLDADPTKRDEAERRVKDLELYVQHYKTAVAVYDGEQPRELCQEWDERESAVDAYQAELEQIGDQANRVASALVGLMVRARDAHARANEAANQSTDLVQELAGYGIQVRESRPNLVTAQSTIALALRKALTTAGLSPVEHFVRECLSPKNYSPPEAFKKVEAA